jgi:hypothetical protein
MGLELVCFILEGVAKTAIRDWMNTGSQKYWQFVYGCKYVKSVLEGPSAKKTVELFRLNKNQLKYVMGQNTELQLKHRTARDLFQKGDAQCIEVCVCVGAGMASLYSLQSIRSKCILLNWLVDLNFIYIALYYVLFPFVIFRLNQGQCNFCTLCYEFCSCMRIVGIA